MGEVEAGWYPDPEGGASERWWDGERWTASTRSLSASAVDSPTAVRPRVAAPANGPASLPPSLAAPPPGVPSPDRSNRVVRNLMVGSIGLVAVSGVVAAVVLTARGPADLSAADADELTVVTPEARERGQEADDDLVVDEPLDDFADDDLVVDEPVDDLAGDGMDDGLEDDGLGDEGLSSATAGQGSRGSPPGWVADEVVERRDGFQLVDGSAWNPDATLNGVVGRRASDGRSNVFFFVEDRGFIGTDTYAPSRHGLEVLPLEAGAVAVAYDVVDDTGSHAGTIEVRYRWQGEELQPLDEIPPLPGEGSGPHR
jgi:hypothetical protein